MRMTAKTTMNWGKSWATIRQRIWAYAPVCLRTVRLEAFANRLRQNTDASGHYDGPVALTVDVASWSCTCYNCRNKNLKMRCCGFRSLKGTPSEKEARALLIGMELNTHAHTITQARTHARTHAHTHTHTKNNHHTLSSKVNSEPTWLSPQELKFEAKKYFS